MRERSNRRLESKMDDNCWNEGFTIAKWKAKTNKMNRAYRLFYVDDSNEISTHWSTQLVYKRTTVQANERESWELKTDGYDIRHTLQSQSLRESIFLSSWSVEKMAHYSTGIISSVCVQSCPIIGTHLVPASLVGQETSPRASQLDRQRNMLARDGPISERIRERKT